MVLAKKKIYSKHFNLRQILANKADFLLKKKSKNNFRFKSAIVVIPDRNVFFTFVPANLYHVMRKHIFGGSFHGTV